MTRILVIEDEDAIRANVIDLLEVEGFELLEADNGVLGIQMANEFLPDLIICDVMMPKLSGYEVVKALRQQGATATIPFIFLTARAAKNDFRQGMTLGADDYLTKPFTAAELLEAISSQLAKQAAIAKRHQLELQQLETQFNKLLCYDSATGLPNQFLLRDQFKQLLDTLDGDHSRVAILCLSLQQFERFTTTLNSHQYHQLLTLLVARLHQSIQTSDSINRVRENQFVILLTRSSDRQNAVQTAHNILQQLVEPFALEEQRISPAASIGISFYPDHGTQIETLVKNAEIAAQAISHQPNNCKVYTPDLSTKNLEKLILQSELQIAWEEGYFQLYYQPKINIQTGQLVGAEALIRCLHPKQGMLSPARFIPIAEETGLIIPLGEWIICTACQQAKIWHEQGYPDFRIAVNLSSRQFNQPDLEARVIHLLSVINIAPNCLELEITESGVMENLEAAIAILQAFRERGIHIALDDFGTGYSSLSYLKQIPLDILKIDRSFISNIQDDPQNKEIVKNIIQMARSLDLKVTAEGVETESELNFLRQHQCDELQGYLFSRPLPVQDFETLLRNTYLKN